MSNSSVPHSQSDCTPKVVVKLSPAEDRPIDWAAIFTAASNAFRELSTRVAPYIEGFRELLTRVAPYIEGFVTTLTNLVKWLKEQEHSEPTCLDDVLTLLFSRLGFEITEGEQYQAARRLATQHLSLRYVYLSSPGLQNRWDKVRPAFEAYCREHGLSLGQAWEQLVVPIVYDLVHRDECLKAPLDAVQQWLAKELRKELERELLGRTVDQDDPADALPLPDPDVPEELAELRVSVVVALAQLDPVDRALLVKHHCEGYDYRTLADELGMSEAAVRKRAERTRRKLRSLLNGDSPPV